MFAQANFLHSGYINFAFKRSGKEIIEILHRHFRNIIQCLFGQKTPGAVKMTFAGDKQRQSVVLYGGVGMVFKEKLRLLLVNVQSQKPRKPLFNVSKSASLLSLLRCAR